MYLIALVILGGVWDGIGQMAYDRSFATRFFKCMLSVAAMCSLRQGVV